MLGSDPNTTQFTDAHVVTLMVDSGVTYLSTDGFRR